MTDLQPQQPVEPEPSEIPVSREAALTEIDQIGQWATELHQMQQQAPMIQRRADFLRGWLAAHDTRTVPPTKRTTPRGTVAKKRNP